MTLVPNADLQPARSIPAPLLDRFSYDDDIVRKFLFVTLI